MEVVTEGVNRDRDGRVAAKNAVERLGSEIDGLIGAAQQTIAASPALTGTIDLLHAIDSLSETLRERVEAGAERQVAAIVDVLPSTEEPLFYQRDLVFYPWNLKIFRLSQMIKLSSLQNCSNGLPSATAIVHWNKISHAVSDLFSLQLKRLDLDLINVVEAEIGMNWKPVMSKAEAEEYTRDSYYSVRDFYHGTDAENLAGLTSAGARLESESVNSYGDGFYLAFSKQTGIDYANQADRPALVSAKVRVRKPKKFADSIDFESFLEENNIPSDDFQSKTVTKLLISQGFDAVEIEGNRILVIIFDRRQIAIYEVTEL